MTFIAFGVSLFALDALLKAYVHFFLPPMALSSPFFPYGGIGVLRDWHGISLSLVHVTNRGAAWGAFAAFQEYLLYVRILIVGGLFSYLFFVKTSTFRRVCLLLIAVGALGNIADTFIYGYVIDMFYFIFWSYSYPVFNIADSMIFCGIALLLGEALFAKVREQKTAKRSA